MQAAIVMQKLKNHVLVGTVLFTSLMFLMVIWIWLNDPKPVTNPSKSKICGYKCSFKFKAWNDEAVTVLQPPIVKNCSKLFGSDEEEIKRVNAKTARWKNSLSDHDFFKMTMDCSWVRHYFSSNLYVTELERSFPIAFLFVVHNSPQQVVRMLKVIYRTNNQYCIIPDSKSRPHFIGIFKNIAACLSNVQIASKLIPVKWGKNTILQAQLICFKDLLDSRKRQSEQSKWKYVINLCGKELPLATNHEIISHLVKLNGSAGISPVLVTNSDYENNKKRLRGGKIPFNLSNYKSSTYMALPYIFVSFLITNSMSIKVRQFFESCLIPEEHFYAVLSVIPGVPGGFDSKVLRVNINHDIWLLRKDKKLCSGKIVHDLCIPKINDLSMIMRETENGDKALFYNKYLMEYDHTLMDCMEEELIARNKKEFAEDGGQEECDLVYPHIC